jgi:hypothetical protein
VLDELVFVGGCTTGLLISDEGAGAVRPTFDVDAITEITSYADYFRFSERLRKLGFTEDTSEGAPLCRWEHGTSAQIGLSHTLEEITWLAWESELSFLFLPAWASQRIGRDLK